uniref:E1 ubiquitin-activating enzyme n=1 Tax=Gouania willdenowi TaxID=441366 RepID=A0A8C5I9B3_GOUWI
YVLGDSAMHQMAQSSVFLSGMGGLGVEIVCVRIHIVCIVVFLQAVTLHDTKQCETWDLGCNFFIHKEDVFNQRRRVEVVCPRVAELNPYVHVDTSLCPLDDNTDLSFLRKYQCVILTEARLSLQKRVNEFCHSQQPPIRVSLHLCDAFGICVRVFCDFGEEFEVSDPTGEEPKEIFIQNISQDNPGVVTCMDNQPHGLQTGQSVIFREVGGMEELNGSVRQATVLSPHSFSIGDTAHLHSYAHGGYFVLVKTPKTFRFVKKIFFPFKLVLNLSRTARGTLPPLAAAVGGVASQEVLKAITGKFAPLQQWLYIDAFEVVGPLQSLSPEEFLPRGDRYDALRACIGESMCIELQKLRVFMVGCGAIGCEMLKNFALLGVGLARSSGEVCITDPDLIEKSNLNRQFLFRPHHLQKPKSTTAAEATRNINPDMQVDAHLNKVCPATESIYNDSFYSGLNLVVTALDNVEARRYVDSRCVSNQRALLDSGTMGTKGHTEIIVPNLTESYNSHRDPPEEEIPFCTLKSFPSVIEHTIQWARDKVCAATFSPCDLYQLRESLESSFQVIKLMSRQPSQWEQCIAIARLKFEKYFKRKALQLLHSFPLDTRLKDGSLFWQSPKRPPTPIEFDLHFDFVVSTARLFPSSTWSRLFLLTGSHQVLTQAGNQVLEEIHQCEHTLSNQKHRFTRYTNCAECLRMSPLQFEKDDDSNGHIDFITAASALRAKTYNIEPADRLKTKRIAGKIIPAIATATAAVAGLVALELIKVVGGYGFESFKNCFFNLAIPVFVLTEPAAVKKTPIR